MRESVFFKPIFYILTSYLKNCKKDCSIIYLFIIKQSQNYTWHRNMGVKNPLQGAKFARWYVSCSLFTKPHWLKVSFVHSEVCRDRYKIIWKWFIPKHQPTLPSSIAKHINHPHERCLKSRIFKSIFWNTEKYFMRQNIEYHKQTILKHVVHL